MTMSGNRDKLLAEKARLKTEIADLEAARRLLGAAIGELAHDGRRLTDALERVGWQSFDLEARKKTVSRNQSMNERELEEKIQELETARRRLAEIDTALDGLDD